MGELVNLWDTRRRRAAAQAFGRWEQKVGYRPQAETRFSDLPDPVLALLAELGHEATLALYDVVLGVRGWGAGERFSYLEAKPKVEALDAFLFLADQVRFDLMRRLGWVRGVAAEAYPIVDLAMRPLEIQAEFSPLVPELTRAYGRYHDLERRLAVEPAAVVRSLIPEALLVFRRLCRQG
ncbi:MAG: hypothetical protein LDL11_00645 [Desulfarculus sp.]|nr:hypothetical protein [Desulfarculus sp.]